MRKVTLFLAAIAVMSSCGNSNQFAKRKYTSGIFVQKSGVKKSSRDLSSGQDTKYEQNESFTSMNENVVFVDELITENDQTVSKINEVEMKNDFLKEQKSNGQRSSENIKEAQTTSEIEKPGVSKDQQKSRKEKENKSTAEKHAKMSFWFGIAATVLGLTFITLALVSQSSTIGVAWSVYFLVRKAMLIFAFLGAGFGVASFLAKDDSNNYKRQAKIGFWMSVFVLLFFLV